MQRVVIVGGGLVGNVLALYLARRGLAVTIYERDDDPRRVERVGRPSISITLCTRGLRSLERVGVAARIRPMLSPAYGRMTHGKGCDPVFQPYSIDGQAIYCVTRRDLALSLIGAAVEAGVRIEFRRRCVAVDPIVGEVVIEDGHGRRAVDRPSCVIAADGSHSQLRRRLAALGSIVSSEEQSAYGYKEIPITAAAAAEAGLWRQALHVWPRHDLVAGAFAKADGSFTGSLHMAMAGRRSFASCAEEGPMAAVIAAELPELERLAPGAARRLAAQRPNSMTTVRCRPWSVAGKVLLIGDAAHAMLPHYGQGANAGFEDCALFDDLLAEHGCDWPRVFSAFEARRRPDTDAMTDLSDEHAVVLRELVGQPQYERRRRIEEDLQRRYPDQFVSLYSMITFSTMPYAEARRRDQAQQRRVDDLARAQGIAMALRTGTGPVDGLGLGPGGQRSAIAPDEAVQTPC